MGVIKENQQAKLYFKGAKGSVHEISCSLKKIYKDRISLDIPEDIEKYTAYLQEGDDVSVNIYTPTGINMYDAIIIDSPSEGDFTIEFVEEYIKEVQRRKHLRVSFRTKVILLREKGNIITYTSDIGGGGIRFHCEKRIKNGHIIDCMIYLPPQLHSIKARGVVLKDEYLQENEYVLTFTKIDEFDREKIIKKTVELSADNLV